MISLIQTQILNGNLCIWGKIIICTIVIGKPCDDLYILPPVVSFIVYAAGLNQIQVLPNNKVQNKIINFNHIKGETNEEKLIYNQ